MEVTLAMYLTVCPLIFLAALVDSIGGGGGLISLPTYLLVGLPPVMAAGTNKCSAFCGSLMATVKFFRKGKILLLPALCAVGGAIPASYLGAYLLQLVNQDFIRIFMLVAIPVVAVALLFKRDLAERELKEMTGKRMVACFFIGLGCGFYDGFFGPGTGTFLILLFTWVVGMDMVTASGTAKLVNLSSNVAALFSLVHGGQVLFKLAIPAMICSMAGGYLGAQLTLKRGAKLIRYVMLGVLALLIAKLVADYFF